MFWDLIRSLPLLPSVCRKTTFTSSAMYQDPERANRHDQHKISPSGNDSRSILFDSLFACGLGPVVLTQAPQHCEHEPLQPVGQNLGL